MPSCFAISARHCSAISHLACFSVISILTASSLSFAFPVLPRMPDGHLFLHRIEYGRLYDGIVAPFHIILRGLALIDLFLF